ncbi:MAG: Rpn family recombination-promoting nuclease/putative transposase, partial [Lachnospiraceae bacterium]|nr:Rpn family recombination-promoting nuclease/putative transposase [Lachnospiraceae bacterium]
MTQQIQEKEAETISDKVSSGNWSESITAVELSELHGTLDIPMTNDYLFRALLQQNNRVLKALICALLHLDPANVQEVSVENPIELGKSYAEKDLILDIKALLNGNMIINLEMQVVNEHNWQERSLCYLCRSFDNLNQGMDYSAIKPAVQIGILNFSLFSEFPEFYANYFLMNEKTHHKYSDKFRLAVLDLTQIRRATGEDREYKIDQWAKFFRSRDWSELAMLARENMDIQEAVGTVFRLSREQQIRQQCEAREDYYKREHDRQRRDRMADERDRKADERDKKADERDKNEEEREKKDEEREQKEE